MFPSQFGRRFGDEGTRHMKSKYSHYYGATPRIFTNAKNLRKPLTPAEELFWKMVRNRKLLGLKFRRQHPVASFIADFYCHELLLVIEIDGTIHELKEVIEYDKEREIKIIELGLNVLRFKNEDVFFNPDFIEETIKSCYPQLR